MKRLAIVTAAVLGLLGGLIPQANAATEMRFAYAGWAMGGVDGANACVPSCATGVGVAPSGRFGFIPSANSFELTVHDAGTAANTRFDVEIIVWQDPYRQGPSARWFGCMSSGVPQTFSSIQGGRVDVRLLLEPASWPQATELRYVCGPATAGVATIRQ